MKRWLSKLGATLRKAWGASLRPPCCVACHRVQSLRATSLVCEACHSRYSLDLASRLDWIPATEATRIESLAVNDFFPKERVLASDEEPFPVYSVFPWSATLKQALYRYKFARNAVFERHLAFAWKQHLQERLRRLNVEPEHVLLLCPPARSEDTDQRWASLLQSISWELGLTMTTKGFLWQRPTLPQHHTKSRQQRWQNLKQALSVNPYVLEPWQQDSKSVFILCDDLKTTGATLFALRQALLTSGFNPRHLEALVAASVPVSQPCCRTPSEGVDLLLGDK
jgi:predicted amidophosphoribosyltransferase